MNISKDIIGIVYKYLLPSSNYLKCHKKLYLTHFENILVNWIVIHV